MAWYRTLGPVTYTDGDQVRSINKAGVRVSLTPAQAAELAGLIALDHSADSTFPRASVLIYDAQPFFPIEGDEDDLYLARDTGKFYQWFNDGYVALTEGGAPEWGVIGGDIADQEDLQEVLGGLVPNARTVNGSSMSSDIVLDADDIDDSATAHKFISVAELSKLAGISMGATANASDADLRNRSTHTGTQTASTISDFNAAADARISAAAGTTVPELVGGKVPTSQIPAQALTTVQTAADETEMLSLVTQEGDVVIRSDEPATYIHNGGSAGTMADFTVLPNPAGAVASVNGQVGTVVLGPTDLGLGNVDNTSDEDKPVSTAQQSALDLKASVTHSHPVSDLDTTGTPDGTKFLRDDGAWAAVAAGSVVVNEYTTGTGGAAGEPVPAGAKGCFVTLIGAGGGGGSGRQGANATARNGGGGGGGGNATFDRFVPASGLGSTFTVTVGAAGIGGPAAGAPSSSADGTAGTAGGSAVFLSGSTTLTVSGGLGGAGGTGGGASIGGASGASGERLGGPAGDGGQTTTSPGTSSPGNSAGVRTYGGAGGGGGGVGISSGGSYGTAGGAGGNGPESTGGAGAVRATNTPATSGSAPIPGQPGAGAGGGAIPANDATAAVQAGASATGYGGGGGGGSGARTENGLGSGPGGNGGPAYARVVWIF